MQVYSVDQIIDMGIKVAQKFKELNATITNYDGRVTGLEQTDVTTSQRLTALEQSAGGSGEVDINALKPDILKIIRAELEWYGVERSEYAGTGWYKDANGRVYSKDVPSGETKKFINDPNTYINILDSDLTYSRLRGLVLNNGDAVFATSNLSKLSYVQFGSPSALVASQPVKDVSSWDVGHISNFDTAFFNVTDLLGLGSIDVSNMTSAAGMLNTAATSESVDLSNWNTSKLINAEQMMAGLSMRSSYALTGLENFDTASLTNAKRMFNGINTRGSGADLSGWKVDNLINAESMMAGANFGGDLTGLDDWRVGNVTNMKGMLSTTSSLSLDLSKWCVTNITADPGGFNGLTADKRPVWGTCPYAGFGWYKDPVTGTVECNGVAKGETHTFEGDPKEYVSVYEGMLSTGNMGVAATSNMTNMDNLFSNAFSLPDTDISHWDVKNVKSMNYFMVNTNFNGDLSSWRVPLIASKPVGFLYGTPIENDLSKHPQWGVS